MYPAAEDAELGVKLVSLSKGDVPDPAPTEGDINLSIGRRIRRRRKLLGMTQGDLAAVLGLQFQQVQKYECSANRISASRLHFLAAALKVPISYFFSELPNDAVVGSNRNDRAVMATAEFLSEKETRELLDAYAKLPERVRRRVRELAKALGEDLSKTHVS
jgi:transcriptional regulator with XRE-family HTH domain